MTEALILSLDGARLVDVDEDLRLVCAWFGGCQVHAYGFDGASLGPKSLGPDAYERGHGTREEAEEAIESVHEQVRRELAAGGASA